MNKRLCWTCENWSYQRRCPECKGTLRNTKYHKFKSPNRVEVYSDEEADLMLSVAFEEVFGRKIDVSGMNNIRKTTLKP